MIFEVGTEPKITAFITKPDTECAVVIFTPTAPDPVTRALMLCFEDFSDLSVLIDELQRVLDEGLAYRREKR